MTNQLATLHVLERAITRLLSALRRNEDVDVVKALDTLVVGHRATVLLVFIEFGITPPAGLDQLVDPGEAE
ncbi:MAG TPA: hypothetical protein PLL39_18445 [Rhodocyclaceae bacterium]|nr:hypothetical protein [Rhodocyclaceae bacterium]